MPNDPFSPDDLRGPTYRIRLRGHLSPRVATRFENMTVDLDPSGDTILVGPVADQAALHALLRAVRDLGMDLVQVVSIDSGAIDDEP